jgi:hypothetical protein
LKEDVGHFCHCFEAFAFGFWHSDGEGILDMGGFGRKDAGWGLLKGENEWLKGD